MCGRCARSRRSRTGPPTRGPRPAGPAAGLRPIQLVGVLQQRRVAGVGAVGQPAAGWCARGRWRGANMSWSRPRPAPEPAARGLAQRAGQEGRVGLLGLLKQRHRLGSGRVGQRDVICHGGQGQQGLGPDLRVRGRPRRPRPGARPPRRPSRSLRSRSRRAGSAGGPAGPGRGQRRSPAAAPHRAGAVARPDQRVGQEVEPRRAVGVGLSVLQGQPGQLHRDVGRPVASAAATPASSAVATWGSVPDGRQSGVAGALQRVIRAGRQALMQRAPGGGRQRGVGGGTHQRVGGPDDLRDRPGNGGSSTTTSSASDRALDGASGSSPASVNRHAAAVPAAISRIVRRHARDPLGDQPVQAGRNRQRNARRGERSPAGPGRGPAQARTADYRRTSRARAAGPAGPAGPPAGRRAARTTRPR